MLSKNLNPAYGNGLPPQLARSVGTAAADEAKQFFVNNFAYLETPLVAMPALAQQLGVAQLNVKDESARLGLGSFKALGGVYAVARVVRTEAERRLQRCVAIDALGDRDVRAVSEGLIVCCATDGNHGRSVAMGARHLGCRAIIFLHEGVSEVREQAIAAQGAEIRRVAGNYDHAVASTTRLAEEHGWAVVSDMSWPGYEQIPMQVMQGYTVLAQEVASRLSERPTHVFLQAGVGGFAAAVAGFLSQHFGDEAPKVVVVEPSRAACVYQANVEQRIIRIKGGEPTVMAMLECYEASYVAWQVLSRVADFFLQIDDPAAIDAMKRFAFPIDGDPVIVAGESGAVGLAGLIDIIGSVNFRQTVGLTRDSRILLFNTEGATDPGIYEKLVGVAPPPTIERRSGRST